MNNRIIQENALKYFIFLSVFVCFRQVNGSKDRFSSRVVITKYGSLRGIIRDLANKDLRPVEIFYGVPYASAPIGSLRFMPPVTPPHWRGIRNASMFGPVCPQKFPDIQNQTEALKRMPPARLSYLRRLIPFLSDQSEDCLYLNIYAPAILLHQTVRVPVIVFIQGESYEWNSGNPYDGSVIASIADVIVITFNFRLGILGFFPALEGAARGNYGLMDQVAALHWIQENIMKFGGDIHNVTIMGHGHGAAFVNLLMVSPMARGLFHRGIMHSGSALSPWAIARQAPEFTRQLASKLGCSTVSNIVMVECLRDQPIEHILKVELTVPDYLTAFGPVVDGIVIPNEPEVLMRDYNDLYNQYDLLLGVSRMEFYFKFSANEERYGIEEDRRNNLFQTLVKNVYTYHLQEIFYVIENEYTDWEKAIQHPINILESTADAMGDGIVVGPLLKSAEYRAKGNKKTFLFVFGHQTENSEFPKRFGCIHGEDLPYAFGVPLVGSLAHFQQNFSRSEMSLAEAVLAYWTTFAKTGDPNVPLHEDLEIMSSRFERVEWPTFNNVHQKYLSLGTKPKVRDHYRAHQLSFWNNLIPKIHRSGTGEYPHHSFLGNPHSRDGVLASDLVPTKADENVYSIEVSTVPTTLNLNVLFETSSEPSNTSPAETTPGVFPNHSADTAQPSSEQSTYSTALSVTIAVGCSLLILNVLIFTGMFYQKDKNRLEAKLQKNNHKMKIAQENDNVAVNHRKQVSRVPPLSPSSQELPPPPPAPLPTPPKVPDKTVYVPPEGKPVPEAQPLLHHGCHRLAPPLRSSVEEMRV